MACITLSWPSHSTAARCWELRHPGVMWTPNDANHLLQHHRDSGGGRLSGTCTHHTATHTSFGRRQQDVEGYSHVQATSDAAAIKKKAALHFLTLGCGCQSCASCGLRPAIKLTEWVLWLSFFSGLTRPWYLNSMSIWQRTPLTN